MNESDTPRTDAQATGNSDPQQDEYEDLLYFTRTLERELTAARAELAEWHDAAESVKAEYPDEVHCTCVPILRKQIKTLTEQRDDLLRYNEAFRKETLICADCDAIRKGEYDQAIEQRDRLRVIAGQLIAMIRINFIGGTFQECTIEQIDEHLKPWIDKIAAVEGGSYE